MKLQLKINNTDLTFDLLTPSGERIEGVKSIKLPELPAENSWPTVWIEMDMASSTIGLAPDPAE